MVRRSLAAELQLPSLKLAGYAHLAYGMLDNAAYSADHTYIIVLVFKYFLWQFRCKQTIGHPHTSVKTMELHRYLKKHQYSTQTGPTFLFDEHGEYISGLQIYNYIISSKHSESCIQCPDMEWPNEKKIQCIAKTEEFLSYSDDVISIIFSFISVLFLLITGQILGVFTKHRNTPIVRANNRGLSFVLLVSIKLSFLSVLLFLGRPVDITCMLRIITFGITFSIAVSSLLAKTIMVCVAFKATKPGSSWRKWLGVKLSNSVVLFCSSIQIIICMTWLAISPPFQELDIHTSPGTIIIQCNEGSAIGFYSVIGYMGLLAAVSFVLAFLARSLPDSFNEAKYI
ncbi:vomeronasal type-2 receptor 26, partial [Xenopus tropicalis]|uniref:Vomeronasal type-2 receptor 26 n=1 Tax=Xenopus tropicalis TaxID=8364 RepID=A0A8J0SXI1_XENTR